MLKTFIQKKYNYILILTTIFLIYFPACFYDFVWDDLLLIVNNSASKGLSAFFGQIGAYPLTPNRLIIFRPLTFFTFALNYDLFGQSPLSFHLLNIILHGFNMILVFKILKFLTCHSSKSLTFFCILYGLFPLHAGAVTYISGRSELLAAFFILLAFLTFMHFVKNEKISLLTASVLFAALAAFAKETAVIIVPFTFFYILLFYQKKNKLMALFKYSLIPFSLSLLPYTLWRLYYSSHSLHLQTQITKSLISVSFPKRFLVFISSMPKYLSYLFNPWQKINVEILPVIDFSLNATMTASFAFIAICIFLIYRWIKNKNTINAFLTICFFCGLLPFSNLVIPTMMIPKAHFLYLPGIGITFVLFRSICGVFARKNKPCGYALAIVLLCVITGRTFYVNSRWKNEETLYAYNLKQNPEKIYFNQGLMFFKEGKYEKAEAALNKSISLSLAEIRKNYAIICNTYAKNTDVQKAIQAEINKIDNNLVPSHLPQILPQTADNVFTAYQNSDEDMELKKNLLLSFKQLKLSLSALGSCQMAKGNYRQAKKNLNNIISAFTDDKEDYGIYYNLGFIAEKQNDFKSAKTFYEKSAKLNPLYLRTQEALKRIQ